MEFISSNCSDNSGSRNEMFALQIQEENKQIISRFGSPDNLIEKFGIANQRLYLKHEERAITSNVPSLRKMLRAYGEDVIMRLLRLHVTEALECIADDGRALPTDVERITMGMVDMPFGQSISFPTILAFFYALKNGDCDIYGRVTTRKVMECFRNWCEKARIRQDRMRDQLEKEREEKRLALPAPKAVTWEEYRALRGIKEKTCVEYILASIRREGSPRKFPPAR